MDLESTWDESYGSSESAHTYLVTGNVQKPTNTKSAVWGILPQPRFLLFRRFVYGVFFVFSYDDLCMKNYMLKL
jgi:hypothetical protein